ncbi:type II toxin-antitoxin system PemK/MazF family toxin [Brachybacterium fresconis]|uniref:mRNA-degrading endonuclease toxin of MazEF toxin-antitoxin module n=1 Tax=Brachybacterium fresconis TaxID=173363 RepID=A0ABS4YFS9_9MICO|nr:type II toxin-antitoxin system PemK/MazF family toxin [Brachybacterium fresconis]MBP2407651.1 mRNA-degrading endonuclease toxin of MazEF toxin-antitoxin module [Brachybacterium fresconis]
MSLSSRLISLVRTAARSPVVRRGVRDLGRSATRAVRRSRGDDAAGSPRSGGADRGRRDGEGSAALHDRDGSRPLAISYAPHEDHRPDPGEVVWAWVPYEEDITRGKDRPVLVLAREQASDGSGDVLIALMLTSRDRADSGEVITDEHGSSWVDIGSGDWDRQGRPSEVRADRLLRLDPETVRREGGRLDEPRFDRVAKAVRGVHGARG